MAVLAFFHGILLRIFGMMLSALLVWNVPPNFGRTTIEPLDQDNVKLQFSVMSDVHVETNNLEVFEGFAKALRDIAASKHRQNALVLLGDNTTNGKYSEYVMLYSLLSHYNCTDNTLAAIGNHDMAHATVDPREAIALLSFFYQSYTGTQNDKPYYSKTINGCPLIVLGGEVVHRDATADFSAEQLAFLDDAMRGAETGKPIFVFLHQPLSRIGAQAGEIRGILERYKNVYFFSGHLHSPQSVTKSGGVTYVNLPSLTGIRASGTGYQVEVYDDTVVLRARNYIAGEWLEDDVYTAKLK